MSLAPEHLICALCEDRWQIPAQILAKVRKFITPTQAVKARRHHHAGHGLDDSARVGSLSLVTRHLSDLSRHHGRVLRDGCRKPSRFKLGPHTPKFSSLDICCWILENDLEVVRLNEAVKIFGPHIPDAAILSQRRWLNRLAIKPKEIVFAKAREELVRASLLCLARRKHWQYTATRGNLVIYVPRSALFNKVSERNGKPR